MTLEKRIEAVELQAKAFLDQAAERLGPNDGASVVRFGQTLLAFQLWGNAQEARCLHIARANFVATLRAQCVKNGDVHGSF